MDVRYLNNLLESGYEYAEEIQEEMLRISL